MRDRLSVRALEAQSSVCDMLEALHEMGVSDREIGEQCHVHTATVWRWRTGEQIPRLGHVVDLEAMVERMVARGLR